MDIEKLCTVTAISRRSTDTGDANEEIVTVILAEESYQDEPSLFFAITYAGDHDIYAIGEKYHLSITKVEEELC